MKAKPVVAVYRHDLLAISEHFIRAQAEHLQEFEAVYVGLRRIPGLELPADRVVVVENGSKVASIAALWLQLGRVSRSFERRVRARRPTLVHAHFEGGGIVAMPLARALGLPLVVTCHGFDVTIRDDARWPNPILRQIYLRRRRQLQNSGAHFVAVSEHIRRAMLDRGYPPERTHVIHIGVDVERLQPDPTADREPIVLFVGRMVEKKGAEYLIRAMQAVEAAVPEARLVLVGNGPLRASLDVLARGTLARATFLGELANDEVLNLMRRARVLSVPTIRAENGDTDGCAMVFAEAHALGLPVVSFATGGTPEVVLDGRSGWLVQERDVDGLARSIINVLTDGDRWRAFSLGGRAHARVRFSLREQTTRLEGLYKHALSTQA
jgi:glycosyltransferase involved in cell wall biosynthesis